MGRQGRSLYAFIGVQSFLIGIFPFYIPVYLFKTGGSLALICAFIAATGLGFVISLYLWDRLSKHLALNRLMVMSLFGEWGLVSLFFLDVNVGFILVAGVINGLFNCSFWMVQRLLFLDTVTPENSGKKFGNFQIVVFLVLKAGIFAGGALLDWSGYGAVFLATAAVAGAGSLFFIFKGDAYALDPYVLKSPPLKLKAAAGYSDPFNSKPVFAVDGVFLYLESYFWMISLFLIVKQRFWAFGILVIVLAVLFSFLFLMIKNHIDRIPGNTMYRGAVLLYGFSWILRGMMDSEATPVTVFFSLAVITFCTSIFRLAFNKRFFDIAVLTTGHEYIFIKSYVSQLFLALVALAGMMILDDTSSLSIVYLAAAPFSMVYLCYHGVLHRPPSNFSTKTLQ